MSSVLRVVYCQVEVMVTCCRPNGVRNQSKIIKRNVLWVFMNLVKKPEEQKNLREYKIVELLKNRYKVPTVP